MKLITTFEEAYAYANRLGLAGDPRTTVMRDKQANLSYYVEEMLKAAGIPVKKEWGSVMDSWPCKPFFAHWSRRSRKFADLSQQGE